MNVVTLFFVLSQLLAVHTSQDQAPKSLSLFLETETGKLNQNGHEAISLLMEGQYIGNKIDIFDESIELSGSSSTSSKTTIEIGADKIASHEDDTLRNSNVGTCENCLFSLWNSSLSIKSIDFSLIDNSAERRQQKNEARASRLAIVTNSMLTIADSVLAVPSISSPILISSRNSHSSTMQTSVLLEKCSISNDVGEMRGIVETSAFPSFGGSVSVSIVGCSFDSATILGNDGVGLSLTRTADQSGEDIGTISSSLIGCSFVNMSSIDSSCQPHLPHLSQTMLGCVVSLTSSHLSGSTIRDVNTGGSVLCSNSSFSSLLSSIHDNANPSITLPDGTTPEFAPASTFLLESDLSSGTSAIFSHCHFVSDPTPTHTRPLFFNGYPGSIALLFCSFTNAVCTDTYGGAVKIQSESAPATNYVKITSCNFTDCSAAHNGGGLSLSSTAIITVSGCRCVGCFLTKTLGTPSGGGMLVYFSITPGSALSNLEFEQCTSTYSAGGLSVGNVQSTHLVKYLSFKACSATSPDQTGSGGGMTLSSPLSEGDQLSASNLNFEDCSADEQGGGLSVFSFSGSITLSNCEFIRCKVTNPASFYTMGGGLLVYAYADKATVKGCQFIDCSSTALGGAASGMLYAFEMSDCLLRNCSSKTSGAVCIIPMSDSPIALTNTLFVGNTVSDTPTYFDQHESMKDALQFVDIFIEDMMTINPTNVTINDCWTTTTPNSVGMYSTTNAYTPQQTYHRVDKNAFLKMGPYLTQAVEASLDVVSWRIDLIVKGKVPLESQVYEVTVKEEGGSEQTGKLNFNAGVGSLLPSSNLDLKFSTTYTITKIVGVVPSSTFNAISITAEAWTFNLGDSPEKYSFTTPAQPPTLLVSTAHLTEESQPFAFVILIFDRDVSGSYDIVVEERGKDETITVAVNGMSVKGESQNFRVVGDNRVLTHDTTYTIKSIMPTPGTESAATVWMNKTITFDIPKSLYTTDKKALSPEMKAMLSWLIPVIVSVCVALLVAIIVIVLLRRRYKKSQTPAKEMEEQVHVQVEDKMDVLEGEFDGHTQSFIRTDGMSHSAFASSNSDNPTDLIRSREGIKSQTQSASNVAEVMECNGEFPVTVSRVHETLYSVLHKEQRDLRKRAIGLQIVNGLKEVVANRGWSDVLTRLSSHWVLLDSAGNVQLKLQMNASEAEQEATQTQTQKPQPVSDLEGNQNETAKSARKEEKDKTGMDGLRWRAPEVVASNGGQVDGHKAAVFSLGLVLWEIETGQVPFRELDAVNAQRQSGTGVGPKMDDLKNEEFIALIHRCVSVNPKQRPTLTEVGDFLSSHPDESTGASRNEKELTP
ncbi:hypothetical protein BLNAU_5222 [Blattamonas nauphoetae]|uniref:Protein kinase domain-containing protein n=1 Tax=Blattamonas nauphoetae TaxID=2049346 RepID=A0ABQ9Y7M8_9EUKA|nr:hypothetical protein BLNAU_5222 [Blattamonas nauphoetae]